MRVWMKRTLVVGGCLIGICAVAGAIMLFALYRWAVADLPPFNRLSDYRPIHAATVLARDGSQIGLFYNEKRIVVPLSEMSPYLPKALMAVEDAGFYSHKGVDPAAIFRAFIVNLRTGKHAQGGSTITQQVIKRLLLSPERTYERKLKEAILAYRLEKHLTKDEILAIYLNQSFLGSNSYGAEAAARTYFGKHAKDLTLAESAMIAGLPQAPSTYNPYRHPQAARARQLHVLGRMYELDWISKQEYQTAVAEPLTFKSMPENLGLPGAWYLEEVRRELLELFSEKNARTHGIKLPYYGEQAVYELGFTIHTTMDPSAQLAADTALRRGLEASDKRQGWRGPLAHVHPSEIAKAVEEMDFEPSMLAAGKWTRAIVTHVSKDAATVRLHSYTGQIATADMRWARRPNIRQSAAWAPPVSDARRVLHVGDIVLVSAKGVFNKKLKVVMPFNPKKTTPDQMLSLKLQQYPEVQGALVSLEARTGDVIALSGGYNFNDSQFNRATQARRMPGSSFKPIVYSAALDSGFTPMSIVMDAPVVIVNNDTEDVWRPGNFEKDFLGPLPLRTALMLSRNLCTIRVAQKIGIDPIINRAHALGLDVDFPRILGISLGGAEVVPLNLAEAYTAFADNGVRAKARFITKITDRDGNVIYTTTPVKTKAISPQNACLMSYMLQQVVEGGTGAKAKIPGRPMGGKTGTSNDERDAWFFGFTPQLVTGVYVGYDVSRPMGRGETGATAALPIFNAYAGKVLKNYPPKPFPQPADGIEYLKVNKTTGTTGTNGPSTAWETTEGVLGGMTASSEKASSDKDMIVVPFYTGTGPSTNPERASEAQSSDLLKSLF